MPTTAAAARLLARQHLQSFELEAARTLLHTARRRAADPGSDYRLAAELHRHAADDHGALAAALLAREHAGAGSHWLALQELRRGGLAELVDHVTAVPPEYLALPGVHPATGTRRTRERSAEATAAPPR